MIPLNLLFQTQGVTRRGFPAVAIVVLGTLVTTGAALLLLNRLPSSTTLVLCDVEGMVWVNGEPAQNVNVAFHPVNDKLASMCPVGRTDDRGVFHLTTISSEDGAPACEYSVTFVWPDPSIEIDECECPDPLIHDRFKGMYASADQSEYRVMVSVPSSSFKFDVWRPRSDDPMP